MGINIKDTKGNAKVTQNIEDSEVEPDALDISVENTGGDVDASQNLKGVKSRKGWIVIVLAIVAAVVTIAGYYFAK